MSGPRVRESTFGGHAWSMDYSGPAELEWRPHASFATTASVQVAVTAVPDGWRVRALSASREDHWGLLVVNYNPFMLCFPDGSRFMVGIGRPGPDGTFDVWDWSEYEQRELVCPACGGPFTHAMVDDNSGADLSGPVVVTDTCGDCGALQQNTYYLGSLQDQD
jgi:hypothetical protein